jgi:3-methyl-2-oxobutanoate hydroxymethyltransferase
LPGCWTTGSTALLVGDSLGMVPARSRTARAGGRWNHGTTTPGAWRAATAVAWVIGDLPFGSYQESREQALRSATA